MATSSARSLSVPRSFQPVCTDRRSARSLSVPRSFRPVRTHRPVCEQTAVCSHTAPAEVEDHDTGACPAEVPPSWILNLPRPLQCKLSRQEANLEDSPAFVPADLLGYSTCCLLRVLALRDLLEPDLAHFDGIARLIWAFLDVPLVWQFDGPNGWVDCFEDMQSRLHVAKRDLEVAQLQGTEEEVQPITIEGPTHDYSIDLVNMLQANLSTGVVRSLRLQNPYKRPAPATQPTPLPGSAQPRWEFETGHGFAACRPEMSVQLEMAFQTGEETMDYGSLTVDLRAMTQTNMGTGRTRRLRRS